MGTALHRQRLEVMLERIRASRARSVLDLGCGNGELLTRLFQDDQFTRIAGVDTSLRALSFAADALHQELADQSGRLTLIHGSFTEPDDQLRGFDAAALVETIEHIDPRQLSMVERTVFRHYRPRIVLISTPNRDYNALFDRPSKTLRHREHQFEWSRAKFSGWATGVANRNGYRVTFEGIGDADPSFGSPTQMAEFTRIEEEQSAEFPATSGRKTTSPNTTRRHDDS